MHGERLMFTSYGVGCARNTVPKPVIVDGRNAVFGESDGFMA